MLGEGAGSAVPAPMAFEPVRACLARGVNQVGQRSSPAVVQVVLDIGRGGLETMCVELAIGIADRGVRSIVVGLDAGGQLEERLTAHGVEFVCAGGRRLLDPRFHWRLARFLKASGATAIHSHHFASLLHISAARVAAAIPTLVHTEHSLEYLLPRADYRRTLRWLAKGVSTFAVLGERMRKYYATEIGIGSSTLRVIPNGVAIGASPSDEDRREARRLLGCGDALVVGTVGRLAPEKNYGVLLRAFASLTAGPSTPVLVLLGDGPERGALESEARALGVFERTRFAGWQDNVARLLPAFDVFALSSDAEGLPLALLEAMSLGIPVVSTRVGDIPDVVQHGVEGLLVDPGDEPGYRLALLGLATSAALRSRLGAAAQDVVRARYSKDAMVNAYLQAYRLDPSSVAAA